LFCGIKILAQGTPEDYRRAFHLSEQFKNKAYHADIQPKWIAGTHSFWYIDNAPEGKMYMLANADKKTIRPLFDHKKFTNALNRYTRQTFDHQKLGLKQLDVSQHLDSLRFIFRDSDMVYLPKSEKLICKGKHTEPTESYWGTYDYETSGDPVVSPDKTQSAFIRDNNVILKNLKNGIEQQISTDGSPHSYYSVYISWSPDSKKIAVMKIDSVKIRRISLIESSPDDQLQPKMHTFDYPKPGDLLPFRTPVIFDIASAHRFIADTTLLNSQFEVRGFSWSDDCRSLFFEYNQRGHQVYRVLSMSAETGKVKTIIEETSPKYINWNRYFRKDLPATHEMIWASERDDRNHLYLYDSNTGTVKNQITKGQYYVRDVVRLDTQKREIIFSACGADPDEDPYLTRYYKIGFDGKELRCLTPEYGTHKAVFSDDYTYFTDTYSTVDIPPVTVLRDAITGKTVMTIAKADISELKKASWIAPEPFVAKGRDGKTDIWGIIMRPTNFSPDKKYPVLEYIYAGPGDQYVPKSFFAFNRYLSPIAELGFIVIQIDGMGTSFRTKSFEEVCWKNLKDAGFPDRVAWTKALAEKYPYIDTTRIGIFGASAGGQEALAGVLFHPEHYKAAYSACGCHDNRMDKIWWNEQWLGYPVGKQYEENSNVVNAHLLNRPLMLVVGEMDDNVDPSSTYQVCNALIKSNKEFELVVLPETNHTMGGDYGEHKRFDFFVRHLLGVNPPDWKLFEK